MSTLIVRMYEAASQAAKAAQHLEDQGYRNVSQFKASTAKGASRDKLVAELMGAHIWKSHAEVYADRLGKGGAMVAIHAPFGKALKVAKTLDRYGPSGKEIPIADGKPDFVWDDAAPLSSVLQMPVLSRTKLPAETISGVSSLTKGAAFLSNLIGMPLLSEGASRKSSSFGMPLLSHSATPLSSMFGMRALSRSATPLSSTFGLAVLSRKR